MTVVHHPEVKKICAKAYLEYIRELNTRIETLREGIERKRSLMLPSGIDYSGVPSSGSAADALGNGVAFWSSGILTGNQTPSRPLRSTVCFGAVAF